jgi:hypothetical protein
MYYILHISQPKFNNQRPPARKLRVIFFLNCLYKWKTIFLRHSAVAVEKKNSSAPYFFEFPGLTSVLDLDPGFGCFSSRRVERTYIYLPGLPKKPGCHKPPFAGLGPPTGSPGLRLAGFERCRRRRRVRSPRAAVTRGRHRRHRRPWQSSRACSLSARLYSAKSPQSKGFLNVALTICARLALGMTESAWRKSPMMTNAMPPYGKVA